jgi:hypothetical protein
MASILRWLKASINPGRFTCSLPYPWDAIHLCARRPSHSMLSGD